jgi:V/A-type H+/Na+-transporting ATPase subunit I
MFRPEPMTHLLVVASRERMETVIRELYSHRVFHIRDYVEKEGEKVEGVTIGPPLGTASDVSSKLVRVRSMETTFGIHPDEMTPATRQRVLDLRDTIDRDIAAVGNETDTLLSRRAALEGTIRDLEQQVRELAPFAGAPIGFDYYRGYENLAVYTGRIGRDVEIPVPHEKVFTPSPQGNFIALFVPVEHKAVVDAILQEARFMPIPVPGGSGLPEALLAENQGRLAGLTEEIGQIDRRIAALKEQQAQFLATCDEYLKSDLEQAEAPLRFATTDQAFLVEGWVPMKEVERVKSGLSLATGGKALVTEIPGDPHHPVPAPVEYDNPVFSRPTQLLMDTYARPRYDELDPTVLVSIIFPIFFGIILGDVGYGLILLAASLGLRKFLPEGDGRVLLKIMRNAAIASIFFGILYSEFFGFKLPWEPLLYSRHLSMGGAEEGHGPMVIELLVLSIWIGILHITLGRILGAMNHGRHHGIRGVIPQLGWIASMWGLLLVIWSLVAIPVMPDLTGAPVVVAGLSLPALLGGLLLILGIVAIASESALELTEFPTIISHTMSYARLVAIGLSSVAIAVVVNFVSIGMLIEPNLENFSAVGVLFILMGVVVFIAGHLLNTALGLVGGALQSLRLQYVEFFTKFYKGGGEKFNPFGMIRRFTED